MKRKLIIGLAALALAAAAGAAPKASWLAIRAGGVRTLQGGLSNVIQDIWLEGSDVYVATMDGLGVTDDRGATWRTFHAGDGLPSNDVVAVAARGGDIWASCIEVVEDPFGGVYYNGKGMAHYDASTGRWEVIGKSRGLPCDGTNELAWDVLVDGAGVVWVALWDGGIGRSDDDGASWELIKPRDDQGRECRHFYSLAKRGDLIWAAAEVTFPNPFLGDQPGDRPLASNTGVFKSTDNGGSWTFYGPRQQLEGFFPVVCIQHDAGADTAWVGSAPPDPTHGEGRGVYKSEDGGASWTRYSRTEGLGDNTVYALAAYGAWAWAGTLSGVSRTDDAGATWRTAREEAGLPDRYITALAAASEEEVWAGTAVGLAYSLDSGATWRAVDLSPKAGPLDLPTAFAFPNPFSPSRDGFITFRYALAGGGNVSLDIYDFAGRRVKRLVDNEYRGPGERIDERWYGVREERGPAANGVYFFTLELDGEPAARGKFVILE